MNGWGGRIDAGDGEAGLRWHQIVRPMKDGAAGGVVLTGFASDEGVRRNQGRPGAAAGPAAFRRAASALPAWPTLALADAGDIECVDGDLEAARSRYAKVIEQAIERGALPIGIGGGHEIAYGTYLGVAAAVGSGRIGVLNFDAHFDLRREQRSTSGTPFLEILGHGADRVAYHVIGISEAANTRALFETAHAQRVTFELDETLTLIRLEQTLENLAAWLERIDHLYLTVCLDVLPAATAPGVSAPAARGVSLEVVEPLVAAAAGSGKLAAADVAELNPAFDLDERTARVAARLVWRIARAGGAS